MKKGYKRLIWYSAGALALLGAYLYIANGFIYYRIGRGNLRVLPVEAKYLMNNDSENMESIKYVALGDSLTAGAGTLRDEESFPFLISQKIAGSDKKVILENLSYPGAKTQDLIDDLLDKAIEAKPDIITLLIGVNDIHNHIPASVFSENYKYILDRLSKETAAKIYIINIPFIGSDTVIFPPLDIYFNSQTKKFNDIIKGWADDYKLQVIDLYSPTYDMLRHDGPHYSSDSFHPSSSGYGVWAQIIYDNFDK